jgi:predicted nucleotidyltransferase
VPAKGLRRLDRISLQQAITRVLTCNRGDMSRSDRLALARAFVEGQVAIEPHISGAILMGSTARGDAVPASDVDIRLVIDEQSGLLRTGGVSRWHEGLFFDVEHVAKGDVSDAAEILADPYLAGSIRDAVILYDRDGALAAVQRAVRAAFMAPEWLGARLAALWPPIARNARELATAARVGDAAEACRALVFALWTACDALLVWRGVSPSWVRGLQKLGQALPAERDTILGLEGTATLTPDQARRFLPIARGARDQHSDLVMGAVEREIDWMMGHALQREALHSLWAGFGLTLKHKLASQEGPERQEAQVQARAWLAQLGWEVETLRERAAQLERYVERLGDLLGVPKPNSPGGTA